MSCSSRRRFSAESSQSTRETYSASFNAAGMAARAALEREDDEQRDAAGTRHRHGLASLMRVVGRPRVGSVAMAIRPAFSKVESVRSISTALRCREKSPCTSSSVRPSGPARSSFSMILSASGSPSRSPKTRWADSSQYLQSASAASTWSSPIVFDRSSSA